MLRHVRGQGDIHFPCSADHEQYWQPYPVDPYSAICDEHTYIHTYLTVKVQLIRNIDYGLEAIIIMVKTICINHSEGSLVPNRSQESYRKGRDRGCEPRMCGNVRESAWTLLCPNCKKLRHKIKDCKQSTETANK